MLLPRMRLARGGTVVVWLLLVFGGKLFLTPAAHHCDEEKDPVRPSSKSRHSSHRLPHGTTFHPTGAFAIRTGKSATQQSEHLSRVVESVYIVTVETKSL